MSFPQMPLPRVTPSRLPLSMLLLMGFVFAAVGETCCGFGSSGLSCMLWPLRCGVMAWHDATTS